MTAAANGNGDFFICTALIEKKMLWSLFYVTPLAPYSLGFLWESFFTEIFGQNQSRNVQFWKTDFGITLVRVLSMSISNLIAVLFLVDDYAMMISIWCGLFPRKMYRDEEMIPVLYGKPTLWLVYHRVFGTISISCTSRFAVSSWSRYENKRISVAFRRCRIVCRDIWVPDAAFD